jgi:branched-chain amino acid transport system ATP-binding protein
MKHGPLLQLKNIDAYYGGLQALRGVDLTVETGEVVALMGPNGAGKSTILKTVFGLVPHTAGSVYWKGEKIVPVSHEIVSRGISFVPQGRRVFNHLTVEENLEIGGYAVGNRLQLKQRISELMELFPVLRHKRKAKSGTLSGGQQQLLALARGLMTNPELLLLDEPTLGLSPKVVKEIFAAIKDINTRYDTAIMVVEHNIKSVLDIVHRAYILDKGQIVSENSPANLLSSHTLEKVFMGELSAP